jgi:hypothetical protein
VNKLFIQSPPGLTLDVAVLVVAVLGLALSDSLGSNSADEKRNLIFHYY